MKNLHSRVSAYLNETETMQLATHDADDKLWICTVHFAAGDDGAMYWFSLRDRNHSQHIRANGNVAVAVVKDPHVKQALQMRGVAEELNGEAAEEAHRVYSARHGDLPKRLAYAKSEAADDPTYYVFRPEKVVMFDEVNFPEDPRQELTDS